MALVQERIRELIDSFHGGSVNAAAKAAGVQQRTLARVVSGSKPSVDLLSALARTHSVTLGWLAGQEPGNLEIPSDSDIPWAEALRWAEVVDMIQLPIEAADAVYRLPFGPRSAATALVPTQVRTVTHKKGQTVFHPASKEALRHSLIAWTLILGAALEVSGRVAVRQKLLDDIDRVRLGFNWVATLMLHAKLLKPSVIEATAVKHGLKSPPSARVRRLMEGTLAHEQLMKGREMAPPLLGSIEELDGPTMAEVTDPKKLEKVRRARARKKK